MIYIHALVAIAPISEVPHCSTGTSIHVELDYKVSQHSVYTNTEKVSS